MNTKEFSAYRNNTCITLFQGYSSMSFLEQLSWTLSNQLKISLHCSFTLSKISAPDYGSFLTLRLFPLKNLSNQPENHWISSSSLLSVDTQKNHSLSPVWPPPQAKEYPLRNISSQQPKKHHFCQRILSLLRSSITVCRLSRIFSLRVILP